MIVVRLQGHLGNQMFTYATGRRLADRLEVDLVLDSSWMIDGRGWGSSRYELGCFDVRAHVRPVWQVARVPNGDAAVRALQRLRPSRRPFVNVIAEERSTNAFVPAVLDAPDNTYLCGYWQFEDYFIDHEAQIRRDFTFPPLNGTAERIAAEIASVSAVAVHARRGDYVGDDRFDIVDHAYYLRALDAIAEAVGEIHLFVFSDDPDWCGNMLQFVHPTTVVGHSVSDGRNWVDMQLMSRCQHHVIANSTYSWWGAWLNPSREKMVIAPREWVRSEKRVGDPVPSSWLRL